MKIIKLVFAIMMMVVLEATASASITLPIGSEATLRNYGLDQVVYGYRVVDAVSIRPIAGGRLYVEADGDGAEDVLKKLFSQKIDYTVGTPEDEVNGYIYLYDMNDNEIFYGNASYIAKEAKGASYEVWMEAQPLFDGVKSAKALYLDETGKTVLEEDIEVDERGTIIFDPYYATIENIIFMINFKDGTSVIIGSDAKQKEVPVVRETASWKIDNHYVVTVGKDPASRVVNIFEQYNNPSLYLIVETDGFVTFNVSGAAYNDNSQSFIDNAYEIIVVVGGRQVDSVPIPTTKQVPFPKGNYRLEFKFGTFGKKYNYVPAEEPGGGKG